MKYILLLTLLITSLLANTIFDSFTFFFKANYVTESYCQQRNGVYSEDIKFDNNRYIRKYICKKMDS